MPVCLSTYWHFHIGPVFHENFPNRIWVSVGFIIHLDPQNRYFSACCCTVALPSSGQEVYLWRCRSVLRPGAVISALACQIFPNQDAWLRLLHCITCTSVGPGTSAWKCLVSWLVPILDKCWKGNVPSDIFWPCVRADHTEAQVSWLLMHPALLFLLGDALSDCVLLVLLQHKLLYLV